jgi:hypothetical protein
MGCDIHLYVERKVDDKWVNADKWTPDPYYDEEDGANPLHVDYDDRFYRGRNYDLFGMLANVRNGHGFAGCDTGDGFKPIATPRGLPADVSAEVRAESDRWDGDGHSHSWFTLAELKAYDWQGQKTKHRGWVDPWNFTLWQRDGKPQAWSGGVSGGRVEHISNQQMARIIDGGDIAFEGEEPAAGSWDGRAYTTSFQRKMKGVGVFPAGSIGSDLTERPTSYYTLVEWEESYADCAGKFLTETMPKLEALCYGKPENVRIVFWFDN